VAGAGGAVENASDGRIGQHAEGLRLRVHLGFVRGEQQVAAGVGQQRASCGRVRG
jgi:hypothetical protein